MSALMVVLAAGMALGDAPKEDDGACTYNSLAGVWQVEWIENGAGVRQRGTDLFDHPLWVFTGNRHMTKDRRSGRITSTIAIALDESTVPARMTMTDGGVPIRALYQVRGDTLRICFDPNRRCVPKELATGKGAPTVFLITLRRVRPGK
jgi:uncharacterized protein (TIGR03067 family)